MTRPPDLCSNQCLVAIIPQKKPTRLHLDTNKTAIRMDWLLPGIPPTGKRVAVAKVPSDLTA